MSNTAQPPTNLSAVIEKQINKTHIIGETEKQLRKRQEQSMKLRKKEEEWRQKYEKSSQFQNASPQELPQNY